MEHLRLAALVAVLHLLVLAMVFVVGTRFVLAHDAPSGWSYESRCCSSFDCRPVERAAIVEGPDGYVIRATGEVLPYASRKIRPSQDGEFHWCSRGGKPDTPTICLYVPHGGS